MFKGSETSDMTSEGLLEMFEGDSADTCAEWRVSRAQTREQGPHRRERILFVNSYLKSNTIRKLKNPKYICDIKTGNIIIIHNVKESINQSRHKGGFSHPRLPLMSHLMRLFILN